MRNLLSVREMVGQTVGQFIFMWVTCRIILAVWLVRTYDLLEDRRADEVVNIFFLTFFIPFWPAFFLPYSLLRRRHRRQQHVVRTSAYPALAERLAHDFSVLTKFCSVLTKFWRYLVCLVWFAAIGSVPLDIARQKRLTLQTGKIVEDFCNSGK